MEHYTQRHDVERARTVLLPHAKSVIREYEKRGSSVSIDEITRQFTELRVCNRGIELQMVQAAQSGHTAAQVMYKSLNKEIHTILLELEQILCPNGMASITTTNTITAPAATAVVGTPQSRPSLARATANPPQQAHRAPLGTNDPVYDGTDTPAQPVNKRPKSTGITATAAVRQPTSVVATAADGLRGQRYRPPPLYKPETPPAVLLLLSSSDEFADIIAAPSTHHRTKLPPDRSGACVYTRQTIQESKRTRFVSNGRRWEIDMHGHITPLHPDAPLNSYYWKYLYNTNTESGVCGMVPEYTPPKINQYNARGIIQWADGTRSPMDNDYGILCYRQTGQYGADSLPIFSVVGVASNFIPGHNTPSGWTMYRQPMNPQEPLIFWSDETDNPTYTKMERPPPGRWENTTDMVLWTREYTSIGYTWSLQPIGNLATRGNEIVPANDPRRSIACPPDEWTGETYIMQVIPDPPPATDTHYYVLGPRPFMYFTRIAHSRSIAPVHRPGNLRRNGSLTITPDSVASEKEWARNILVPVDATTHGIPITQIAQGERIYRWSTEANAVLGIARIFRPLWRSGHDAEKLTVRIHSELRDNSDIPVDPGDDRLFYQQVGTRKYLPYTDSTLATLVTKPNKRPKAAWISVLRDSTIFRSFVQVDTSLSEHYTQQQWDKLYHDR
jgi:hypothetical protein